MLGREPASGEQAQELLAEIQKAGQRAAALVRQLLVFSRKRPLTPRVTDLNEMLDDLAQMLRWLLGEPIELIFELDPGLGLVMVDPVELERALINLAVNAREAMPDGGKLTVRTHNVELPASNAPAHADLRAGWHAALALIDTGHGMDEETRARIFEPFFTTKAMDQGTGLGLSLVHGVVRQSGGHIDVASEVGRGASFTIYLPVVELPVEIAGAS
jgi:signal transduction histidine kinase